MPDNDMTLSQGVGARIREVRRKRGMSQADLAAKAKISLPHVSSIELGKTQMMLPMFVRIIEALEVSGDYLLRANVPGVNSIYQAELAELLSDCTPQEMEFFIKMVKELKSTRAQTEEF